MTSIHRGVEWVLPDLLPGQSFYLPRSVGVMITNPHISHGWVGLGSQMCGSFPRGRFSKTRQESTKKIHQVVMGIFGRDLFLRLEPAGGNVGLQRNWVDCVWIIS